MISGHARAIVLLGAQRFDPTLGEAVADLKVEGKIATITAGWQEREEEDDDLREHLGGRTVNLRLHARAEEVFRDDEELRETHREMQTILRHRQDFYRIRMEHALDAQYVIENRKAPPDILEDEARVSIQAIRDIDRMHLERCVRDREEFDARMRPLSRPSITKHIAEIEKIMKDCDALAIAGGHVASLLNRLRLFDIRRLAKGKVIFAWCAGAMAITERIVIFHDSPPHGQGGAEVLDEGLGMAGDVVVLPQPELRLKLDDRERIKTMARRFAPATCLAMPARSRVTWRKRGPDNPHGVIALRDDGMHTRFEVSESGVFQHRGVLGP